MNNTRQPDRKLNRLGRAGRAGAVPAHPCHAVAEKSNTLKYQLQWDLAASHEGRIPEKLVNHAVAEAEALAWSTPFPLLFLPGLAEEKVTKAGQWATRQREILERDIVLALAE